MISANLAEGHPTTGAVVEKGLKGGGDEDAPTSALTSLFGQISNVFNEKIQQDQAVLDRERANHQQELDALRRENERLEADLKQKDRQNFLLTQNGNELQERFIDLSARFNNLKNTASQLEAFRKAMISLIQSGPPSILGQPDMMMVIPPPSRPLSSEISSMANAAIPRSASWTSPTPNEEVGGRVSAYSAVSNNTAKSPTGSDQETSEVTARGIAYSYNHRLVGVEAPQPPPTPAAAPTTAHINNSEKPPNGNPTAFNRSSSKTATLDQDLYLERHEPPQEMPLNGQDDLQQIEATNYSKVAANGSFSDSLLPDTTQEVVDFSLYSADQSGMLTIDLLSPPVIQEDIHAQQPSHPASEEVMKEKRRPNTDPATLYKEIRKAVSPEEFDKFAQVIGKFNNGYGVQETILEIRAIIKIGILADEMTNLILDAAI